MSAAPTAGRATLNFPKTAAPLWLDEGVEGASVRRGAGVVLIAAEAEAAAGTSFGGIGTAVSIGIVVAVVFATMGDGGATETSAVKIGTATGIPFIFVEESSGTVSDGGSIAAFAAAAADVSSSFSMAVVSISDLLDVSRFSSTSLSLSLLPSLLISCSCSCSCSLLSVISPEDPVVLSDVCSTFTSSDCF